MRRAIFLSSILKVALAVAGGLLLDAPRAPREVVPRARLVATPDVDRAARALAAYVRLDTRAGQAEAFAVVTGDDGGEQPAWVAFLEQGWLEPLGLAHELLEGALVVRVPGASVEAPVMWLSHVDTVPYAEEDLPRWTHDPLAGVVADGFVWGRGALDNKASTILQLEALRWLAEQGLTVSRPLVLVVTPDEETDGGSARALAERHLAHLGHPVAVVDEGSYVVPDLLPGLQVGAIAVAEKAYVTYELVVRAEGGHSSMPTGESALDILAHALTRVAEWRSDDALPEPMIEAFARLAHARPFPERLVLANARRLESLLLPLVQKTAAGNAITRDTVVATVVHAGVKDNVIPHEARALLNARLLPPTDPEDFEAALRAVIADDRVELTRRAWPSRAGVSDWEDPTFHAIERALVGAVPGVHVVPSLTPGTMDARHFGQAGLPTYRIHPFVLDAAERQRIHGIDERVSLADLERGLRFYALAFQEL